jgi:hypothetical protein
MSSATIHANRGTLDLPLPADRRAQVLEAGRAKEWFSGWVSEQLARRADADDGIALLRESYDALRAPLAGRQFAPLARHALGDHRLIHAMSPGVASRAATEAHVRRLLTGTSPSQKTSVHGAKEAAGSQAARWRGMRGRKITIIRRGHLTGFGTNLRT